MGALFRAQLPPGKSLFTHPQELIPAVSEACLPAEAGAHRLANTNKRDCVLGASEETLPALFQGQWRQGGCQSQPRAVPGVPWEMGWTPQGSCSWDKCSHQSYLRGEIGLWRANVSKGGECCLLRWGFSLLETCREEWTGAHRSGALMESCIQSSHKG